LGRFDALLNNINREGFGEHRATRQILKERDAIQLQRRRLEQLCQEVRDALRSPRGDRLFDAQKAIERLHAEDPEDAFGLQESLRIEIPFGRTLVLQGLSDIEVWLKQSIEQVRIFGNWLYRSGAPHLWPKELAGMSMSSLFMSLCSHPLYLPFGRAFPNSCFQSYFEEIFQGL